MGRALPCGKHDYARLCRHAKATSEKSPLSERLKDVLQEQKNSRSWWCSWVSSWLRYTGTRAAPRMSSVTLADAENISVILPLAMICVWTKVFAKIFGAEPPRTNKLQLPERKAQGAIITMQCLQNVYTQTIRDKIYSYVYSTQYFGQMQSSLQISGKRKCRVLVFSFVFCCPITKMVSCKCLHT